MWIRFADTWRIAGARVIESTPGIDAIAGAQVLTGTVSEAAGAEYGGLGAVHCVTVRLWALVDRIAPRCLTHTCCAHGAGTIIEIAAGTIILSVANAGGTGGSEYGCTFQEVACVWGDLLAGAGRQAARSGELRPARLNGASIPG